MLNAQHIEAIQQSRKNIFDKQHKKLSLRSGMLVLLRDARKLDFRGILDVVWLGPYLIGEVFPNNSATRNFERRILSNSHLGQLM